MAGARTHRPAVRRPGLRAGLDQGRRFARADGGIGVEAVVHNGTVRGIKLLSGAGEKSACSWHNSKLRERWQIGER